MYHFSMNQKVKMTDSALDNYGQEFENEIFTIHRITKNSSEFIGFDESMRPMWLYDLKKSDGKLFDCALYDCELECV